MPSGKELRGRHSHHLGTRLMPPDCLCSSQLSPASQGCQEHVLSSLLYWLKAQVQSCLVPKNRSTTPPATWGRPLSVHGKVYPHLSHPLKRPLQWYRTCWSQWLHLGQHHRPHLRTSLHATHVTSRLCHARTKTSKTMHKIAASRQCCLT